MEPRMSYYEVLGVSSDATDQQIKEAYRREAMKWHPDRHESAEAKAEATRRFKEIAEAYRHLRDPVARAAYDQRRQQEAHTHAGARQSDQAGQQRRGESTNTRDQQRSEQNARRDQSSHTAPDFDEETMSGEEANNMFFEQMVDLAFELAGRGFPQENIVKALIALGCPESMARAVATLAAQRGKPSSDGFSERTSARDAPALKNLDEATWEEAAPYYEAAILGRTGKRKLTETEFESIRTKRKNRTNLFVSIGALIALVGVTAFFAEKIKGDDAFVFVFLAESIILLLIVLVRNFFLGPKKKEFFQEKSFYYYMPIFKIMHSKGAWHAAPNNFNFYAAIFSNLWFGYRRSLLAAYSLAFGWGAVNLLICLLLPQYIDESTAILSIAFYAFAGIYANWIYFRTVQSKIRSTTKGQTKKQAINALQEKGGVSNYGWIPPFIFLLIVTAPSIAIDFEIKEKQARVERQAQAEKIAAEENSRKAAQEAAAQRAQQDEMEKRAQQEAAKRQASYERENLIRQIEAKFPELDPRSSQHNSNAVSWVVERKVSYEQQGLTSNDALQKAAQDYGTEIQKIRRQNQSNNSGIINSQSSSGNYSGTGELVSLNFGSIEIYSLLQIFSDLAMVNIIQDSEVTGSVSIQLKNTPWDEVLHKVMYAKNLKIIKTGPTSFYVYPGYMSDDLAHARAIRRGFNK